jgi:hypothetical protein
MVLEFIAVHNWSDSASIDSINAGSEIP